LGDFEEIFFFSGLANNGGGTSLLSEYLHSEVCPVNMMDTI
jgi:hypothetical protein